MLETQARIGYWRRRVCPYSRGGSVEVWCTWTASRKAVLVLKVLDGDGRVRAVVYSGMALRVERCFSLGVMTKGIEIAHRLNGGRILGMVISTKHTSTRVRQECQMLKREKEDGGRLGCLPASRAFGLISIVPTRIN